MAFSGLSGVGDIVAKVGIDGVSQFNSGLASMEQSVFGFSSSSVAKFALASTAVAGVGSALVACVKESAAFESAMANIKTIMSEGDMTFFSKMSDDVKELSTVLPFSQTELAKTLYDIVSYGVPAADAMKVLETTAKTAVGGFADVNETFKLFGGIVKAYGLDWSEVNTIADKAFFVSAKGASTIEQLATSIGATIPFAKQLGVSLDEVYAVMSTLPGSTGTTSEAATQLTSALTALLDPSDKMKKALNELGVASGKDLIDKMGGFQGALMALNTYAKEHNIAIGEILGRKEAQLAFFNLVGTQAGEYAKNLKDVADVAGLAEKALNIKLDTTENSWKILTNQVNLLITAIGDGAKPAADVLIYLGSSFVTALGDIASVLKVIDQFVTSNVMAYFENASLVVKGWADALGLAGEKLPTINRDLLLQKEAAEDAAQRGIAPLNSELEAMDKAYLAANGGVQKNTELTEAQKKAIEALNKPRRDYLDSIRREARDELPALKKEIADLTSMYALMGGYDELGIVSTGTVAAVGEIRGEWNQIPPIIGEAKRNTELLKEAERATKEQTEELKEKWVMIIGIVSNFVKLLPGMDSEMQAVVSGMTSAITQMITGGPAGLITGAVTAVTTVITTLKNQVDEANKQELRTFQAYSKEYSALIKEIDGLTGINKDSLNAMIANFEALEQSGKYNREELIPILRDTIRSMYDAKDAAVAERDAHLGDADAVNKNTDAHEALNGTLKPLIDNSADIVTYQNLANEAMARGDEAGERYYLRIVSLMQGGKSLADALAIVAGTMTEVVVPAAQKADDQMKRNTVTDAEYQAGLRDIWKEQTDGTVSFEKWLEVYKKAPPIIKETTKATEAIVPALEKVEKQEKINTVTDEEYIAGLRELYKEQTDGTQTFEEWLEVYKKAPPVINKTTDAMNKNANTAKSTAVSAKAYNDAIRQIIATSTTQIPDDPWKFLEEAGKFYEDAANAGKDFVDSQTMMKDLGIETAASVQAQIAALEALLPYLQEGSYEYQQVTDKIAALKDKLDVSTAAIGSQEWITQQLKDANIETTQSIKDQIAQLEALLPYLQEGSYEYNQVKDKLDALNIKLVETTLNVQKFGLEWDTQLRFITGQFSQFDLDVKQIADTMAQMAYFKIDLDTTGVDEAIGQSILKMEQYLATLDPSSQAYADAKKSIDALKEQFLALGGVMPSELDIDTSQAQVDVTQVKDTVAAIPEDKPFDLDTTQSITDLNWINQVVGLLDASLRNLRAVLDINSAVDNINVLKVYIADLQSKMTLTITVIASSAQSALLDIQQKWDALYKKIYTDGVTVNLIATDAKNKLDILINQVSTLDDSAAQEHAVNVNNSQAISALQAIIDKLALIVDKTVEVIVIETHTSMHEGGLVRHDGGIIPEAHDGELFPNETMITALKGEYVLRPAVTRAFGEDRMDAFNATLNPSVLTNKALGGNQNTQTAAADRREQPVFVIHEASPKTWVEITDRKIHPRIKTTDYHSASLKAFRD